MKRTLAVLGILTAIILSSLTTSTVSGQGAAAPPLVVTAYNNGSDSFHDAPDAMG
jgi:hypothetical protein